MKKVLFIVATLIAFASCTERKASIPAYAWYGWDKARMSADSLRQCFETWKSHGIVGVCIENGNFDNPGTIDQIRECAKMAHEAGLEFHAWIPTSLQRGCDSTWYTVNRYGKSAYTPEDRAYVDYYTTVDPHNPEVMEYLASKYAEVAEIPEVDYIQLDYVRYADVILSEGLWEKYEGRIDHTWRTEDGKVREYPAADYCYCDACVADFKEKTGIDIREAVAAGQDPQEIAEWAQFRCDNVTGLVKAIADAVHAKGKKISADVFPGPASHAEWMVRQQWDKWDVDAFFPMNYNDFYMEPASWVGTITAEETASTDKPVYSGLFICRDWQHKADIVDPENSGLLPSEIGEAVKGAMEAGAAGICLFTPGSMTDEHWAEFDKALGLTD